LRAMPRQLPPEPRIPCSMIIHCEGVPVAIGS
jgi:hypothetical protein